MTSLRCVRLSLCPYIIAKFWCIWLFFSPSVSLNINTLFVTLVARYIEPLNESITFCSKKNKRMRGGGCSFADFEISRRSRSHETNWDVVKEYDTYRVFDIFF